MSSVDLIKGNITDSKTVSPTLVRTGEETDSAEASLARLLPVNKVVNTVETSDVREEEGMRTIIKYDADTGPANVTAEELEEEKSAWGIVKEVEEIDEETRQSLADVRRMMEEERQEEVAHQAEMKQRLDDIEAQIGALSIGFARLDTRRGQ